MDFAIDEDCREQVAEIRAFARSVLAPGDRQRAISGIFSPQLWRQAGEFGLTGITVGRELGGLGLNALTTTLAIEALAEECEDLGFLLSICGHNFACVVPLALGGSPEVKARWLAPLATGRAIGAGGMTEAGTGSDAFAMLAEARPADGDFDIDARKIYVTNAPVADLLVVYARTSPDPGAFGVSAFAVPRDSPGLSVEPGGAKSGLASAPWGTVTLEGCRVPTTAMIGRPGAGAAVFHDAMRWERICLLGLALGATARMLARCIEHVRERYRFGRPIGSFQSVQDRLVGMRVALEASRLLLYRAACAFDRRQACDDLIAMGKIMAAESAVAAGIEAVQLFGAAGITTEHGVDLFLRDMLPLRILSGTTEIQRRILARFMGLPTDAPPLPFPAGRSFA